MVVLVYMHTYWHHLCQHLHNLWGLRLHMCRLLTKSKQDDTTDHQQR